MGKVRVVTDSSCDLPAEVLEELGIVVVPLVVRIGKEEFLETNLEIDEYWRKVKAIRAEGLFPQTSQPSIGVFENVFANLVGEGDEVVCVTLTGKHSGTFSNAAVAAINVSEEISVFDSRSASLGLGFQVVKAAEAALAGASREEILETLRNVREQAYFLAVLDTVEFIRKGGRADRLMPILDKAMRFLNIKPIIGFVEGELKLLGQGRSFSGALRRVEQQVMGWVSLEKLGVIHTRNPRLAKEFADNLRQKTGFAGQILVRETGAVLSSHGGPGVIGVMGLES